MKDEPERLKMSSGSRGFGVIYPILLSIPLGNIVHLIADNFSQMIMLAFADKLASHRKSTRRQ